MDKVRLEKSIDVFAEMFLLKHLRTKYTKAQLEELLREEKRESSIELFEAFCKGERKAAKSWKKIMADVKRDRKEETRKINAIKFDIK